MVFPLRRVAALGVCVLFALAGRASAQGPTVAPPDAARVPESTSLGPVPGSGGTRGGAPADISTILGGRPGPSVPRVPTSVSRPGPGFGMAPTPGITLPPAVPFTEVPIYGPLTLPPGAADEGPPNGLTIDGAIDRLVRENLDLRSQFHEIPKA